jgi:regulator of cell morphogenesis and NO signaling
MAHATDAADVLDVRDLAPRRRHPRIFEAFDALAPGEAFVLVSDHEPTPLWYHLAFARPHAFTWHGVEAGPARWRVRIARRRLPLRATQTVAEVAGQFPGALDAMTRMGVNHCCGAQLTLAEAAAAAGLSLDALLEALDAAEVDAP